MGVTLRLGRFWIKDFTGMIRFGRVLEVLESIGFRGNGEIVRNDLYIQIQRFYRHMLVVGATGAGKTEFLKPIIAQLIDNNIRICVVDGAGNQEFAESVCVMAHEAGLPPVPVLRYSWENKKESSVFDGFTGDGEAIYNRFLSLLSLKERGAESDYYKALNRRILAMACGHNTHLMYDIDVIDPPRSFIELLERLNPDWFMGVYGEVDKEWVTNAYKQIKVFREQVWERAVPLVHLLQPYGFKLGDAPVTIFSINQARGGDTATWLFQFLAECFSTAMSADRDTVWIIDEVSAFESDILAKFAKLGRQNKLGLVLLLQTESSLGRSVKADEIIDNMNTLVVLRCNESETLRKRAGTVDRKDRRHFMDGHGTTKGVNVGSRKDERISHNDVIALPDGAGYLIMDGSIIKFQSSMMKQETQFQPFMESSQYQYIPRKRVNITPRNDSPDKEPF